MKTGEKCIAGKLLGATFLETYIVDNPDHFMSEFNLRAQK